MKNYTIQIRFPINLENILKWEAKKSGKSINTLVVEAVELIYGGDSLAERLARVEELAAANRDQIDDLTQGASNENV